MVAESTSSIPGKSKSGFFGHASGRGSDSALQNATRYLCAAPYLDNSFGHRVIKELIEEEHRAVVPSYGFDLEPVLVHCLRARRLRLVRDLLLSGVLLFGLVLWPIEAAVFLVAVAPWAMLPIIPWRRLSWFQRIVIAFIALNFLSLPVAVAAFGLGLLIQSSVGAEQTGPGGFVLVWLMMAIFLLVIAIGYRVIVFRTLSETLRPGARPPRPYNGSERIRRRIARLASAQRGNVTLYSKENPFLGAGDVAAPWARVWSVVLELDRPASSLLATEKPKPVHPVALHNHIHERLVAMRDEFPPRRDDSPSPDLGDWLPPNERIAGLNVDFHVVARGECAQLPRPVEPGTDLPGFAGHPLIDASVSVPYSVATDAGLSAIIRYPQGGIRCYQRVTVGSQGQAIKDDREQPIAPAEDQDILLSAFIYLAVEGRMLYGQFVATVLPPIRREFHVVDTLPSYSTGTLVARAVQNGWWRMPGESFLGPFRAARTTVQIVRSALRGDPIPPSRYTVFDYGARVSVRELAAEQGFHTFMQQLDADKYTRLIERRLNEAVLDYLQDCHIDTAAYRQQVNMIMNTGVIMTGGTVSGQLAGGAGAAIVQNQTTA